MADLLEKAAVLALVRRGDRPWHHYSDIIDAAGSAVAVASGEFELPFYEPPRLFEPQSTTSLQETLRGVESEIESWTAEGMNLVTVLDDEYPANLRSIHNRPPFLFIRGDLRPEDSYSVAVVGTRNPTAAGVEAATSFAGAIADAGLVVVSGLAEGIDAAAHRAALSVRHRTIAVVGTGLRRVYPAKNADLEKEIATTGAVVSQFWPDAPPTTRTFPLRNIVMSGVSLATVVIEASNTSGARMQARFALEHGRPIFLLDSLLSYEWAQRYADRAGAHVVSDPGEVVSRIARLHAVDTLTV